MARGHQAMEVADLSSEWMSQFFAGQQAKKHQVMVV
jgi:hypothetical protein